MGFYQILFLGLLLIWNLPTFGASSGVYRKGECSTTNLKLVDVTGAEYPLIDYRITKTSTECERGAVAWVHNVCKVYPQYQEKKGGPRLNAQDLKFNKEGELYFYDGEKFESGKFKGDCSKFELKWRNRP